MMVWACDYRYGIRVGKVSRGGLYGADNEGNGADALFVSRMVEKHRSLTKLYYRGKYSIRCGLI
jgi:hypothetical protein